VDFYAHLQSIAFKEKTILLTNEDHKRALIESIGMVSLNTPFVVNEQPFVLVGDPESLQLKKIWYKIRCTFCNDFFQLCPPKKNLKGNLKNHMEGTIEDALSKKGFTTSTLLTRQKGQRCFKELKEFVLMAKFKQIYDTNVEPEGNTDFILGLLCWGSWSRTCKYSTNKFEVHSLLQDPLLGFTWVVKPQTKVELKLGYLEYKIDGYFT
jgi:hypothetical protein